MITYFRDNTQGAGGAPAPEDGMAQHAYDSWDQYQYARLYGADEDEKLETVEAYARAVAYAVYIDKKGDLGIQTSYRNNETTAHAFLHLEGVWAFQ